MISQTVLSSALPLSLEAYYTIVLILKSYFVVLGDSEILEAYNIVDLAIPR